MRSLTFGEAVISTTLLSIYVGARTGALAIEVAQSLTRKGSAA